MKYLEYEFTCQDLDSSDVLTDVVLIKEDHDRDAFDIIQKYIDTKHDLTTLSGNTWEVQSFEKTGLETERVDGKHTKIQPRSEQYFKNYPIFNSDL